MAPMYYRGAHAAIIVYDITNEDSLLDVENWLNQLRESETDAVIQVVGSKADLANTQRAVGLDDAQTRVQLWTSASYESAADGVLYRTASGKSAAEQTTSGSKSISFGGLGFGRGRRSSEMERSRSRDAKERQDKEGRWGRVDVTEVSAKDDFGIEDLFLILARRLVARKVEIEQAHWQRSRDAVIVGDEDEESVRQAGWCC